MTLVGDAMMTQILECSAKWLYGGGPHVPKAGELGTLVRDDEFADSGVRVSTCQYCEKQIFADVNTPSPRMPDYLLSMTLGMLWGAQPDTFVIRAHEDAEDLL